MFENETVALSVRRTDTQIGRIAPTGQPQEFDRVILKPREGKRTGGSLVFGGRGGIYEVTWFCGVGGIAWFSGVSHR